MTSVDSLYCIKKDSFFLWYLGRTEASNPMAQLDCPQFPYFSVGFSRLVRFDGAAAVLRERDLGRLSKLPRGGERQIALAFTNQDGGNSIEAYQSRESHGKIGGL